MSTNLARSGFTQNNEVTADLAFIRKHCDNLGIKHGCTEEYLKEIAQSSIFQRQADIYCRLRTLAKRLDHLHLLGARRIGDLGRLYAESGIAAVIQRVRGHLDSVIDEQDAVYADLQRISQLCKQLYLKQPFGKGQLDDLADLGLYNCRETLFHRLQPITVELGYSDFHRYKSKKDLQQLFKDDGMAAVTHLVRGMLEAWACESSDLEYKLSHVAPQSVPKILHFREAIRNDAKLFWDPPPVNPHLKHAVDQARNLEADIHNRLRSCDRDASECALWQGLSESTHFLTLEAETALSDAQERARAFEQQKLERLKQQRWHINPHNRFYVGGSGSQPKLHFLSALRDGAYKQCSVDLEFSSLDDLVTLESCVDSNRLSEECLEPIGHEPMILHKLHKLGVRHIPQLIDWEQIAEDHVKMRMEHFRGLDAEIHMTNHFPDGLDSATFGRVTRCVLEHLCDLHKHRYVHRDIKPGNILLQTQKGAGGKHRVSSAAVTDFGFTARLGKGKNRLQTECGTLEFAAPEIWDFHQAGTAADIWSLGATLFFLKYGSPFVGDSRDIAKASRHLIVSRSSKLPKSFDGLMDYYTKRALGKKASPKDLCEVDLFILTLLQYDPRARPSAGDALREWEVIERRQQNV
jgi:hypothetical protein